MPFNASGIFQRLFRWQDDRDANIRIRADRMDQEMDGMVDGINQIINGDQSFRGPVKTVNGTAAAPSHTFTADDNTGMYRSATDELSLTAGGVQVAKFTGTTTTILKDLVKGAFKIEGDYLSFDNGDHWITHDGGHFHIRVGHKLSGSNEVYTHDGQGAIHLRFIHAATSPYFEIRLAPPGNLGDTITWSSSHKFNLDGSTSLDVEKLDGLDSTQFVRSDLSDYLSGDVYYMNGNNDNPLRVGYGGPGGNTYISLWRGTDRKGYWQALADRIRLNNDNGAQVDLLDSGVVNINGYQAWHSGNDGANSGLDADKLDGKHASEFALAGPTANAPEDLGVVNLNTITNPGVYYQNTNADAVAGSNYPVDLAGTLIVTHATSSIINQLYTTYNHGSAQEMYFRGYYNAAWSAWRQVTTEDLIRNSWSGLRSTTAYGYIDLGPANANYAHIYTDAPEFYFNKEVRINGGTVWHSGNDGAGSGLDADRLDGLSSSQFLRADINDTVSKGLTFSLATDNQANFGQNTGATRQPWIGFYDGQSTRRGYIQARTNAMRFYRDGGAFIDLHNAGDVRINGDHVVHRGMLGNSIGQYAFARQTNGVAYGFNDTISGANLNPASGDADQDVTTLSGTWRCLGMVAGGTSQSYGSIATLWQRIA